MVTPPLVVLWNWLDNFCRVGTEPIRRTVDRLWEAWRA